MKTPSTILTLSLMVTVAGACSSKGGTDGGTDVDMSLNPLACEAGAKTGSPTGTEAFTSPNGTSIIVRTPANYDPLVASPLIVVFSAANKNSMDTEQATALTVPATARGYIVAYVDHITPQTSADIKEAAASAQAVADTWCTDPNRMYVTGHSDGGSMTTITQLEGLLHAAAIAPSASGVNADYLSQSKCPARLVPHFEMHSIDDKLFPIADGFGAGSAAWFAACAGCNPTPSAPDADNCITYSGCTTEVHYCEGTGSHGKWPQVRDPLVLDFFDRIHP